MTDKPKHPLGERLQEAARDKFGPIKTQAKLVEATGISQSILGRIWRGEIERSGYSTLLAEVCGVRGVWLSDNQGPKYNQSNLIEINNVRDADARDRYVIFYEEIDFSTGVGVVPPDHTELKMEPFNQELMARLNLIAERCFVANVRGRSMEHTLKDGDLVLVDMEDKDWQAHESAMFAFNHGEECRIKRVSQTMNGDMRISSDNEDKNLFPDEIYTESEAHTIEILGRVRWHSGFFE